MIFRSCSPKPPRATFLANTVPQWWGSRSGLTPTAPAMAAMSISSTPPITTAKLKAPPQPGSTNSTKDFEFIEVENISNAPLNVGRFSLGGGVQFQFPNVLLAAGQRAVVVANIAAFQSRYGANGLILGVYAGNLNNSGEHLVLTGAFREPILDFFYDDSWYPITDGLGFSLVTVDDRAAAMAWNSHANWRS